MVKVKSGLSGLTIAQTIVNGRTPLIKLNGNPNFPNPPYPIPEMEADLNAVVEFERAFQEGSKMAKPQRDAFLKTFLGKINLTVGYVNVTAKGDIPMLETTGFPLQKTRSSATVPTMVHRINCCNCQEQGSARITWSGVKGRSYYIVQTTIDPTDENSWTQVEQATAVHCEVSGLEVGKFAFFRVCAVNHAGRGEWSDVARVMMA